jgi:hypothetical protein
MSVSTRKDGPPAADRTGMGVRSLLAFVLAVVLLAAPAAGHARAAAPVRAVSPPVVPPASQTVPPPGFTTSARQVLAIADRVPAVRQARRNHPRLRGEALVWDATSWEIDYVAGGRPVVEVDVSRDGKLSHVWTGLQAEGYFTRGGFGGLFDTPWIWAPFALLFLAPFVDPRRPWRLLHLDLLALLSFGASYWCFSHGRPELAMWLVYPPLLYLLGRMLVGGLRPRRPRGRLVPLAPTALLAVGLVVLVGARIGLNIASDRVVDVGYASVVGADRVAHKQQLYVDNESHGDTYGPVNYIAYIPFEIAFPWKGVWDQVPAARAASIAFDLLTLLGLFLLGRRLRAGPEGRRLGLALAWAWAAFPFTLFGLMQNTNDGLVAMLLVFTLVAFASPAARGAVLGLAAGAKFFPGALLLLAMRGRGDDARLGWLRCAAACAVVFLFSMLLYLPPGGLHELWACTLGYQLSRPPDFSPWALHDGIGWTQTALQVAAVVLALVVALLPGRRSLPQVAALGAAVTIALQLPAGHWFYFYILWFAPLVLVALLGEHATAGNRERADRVDLGQDRWVREPLVEGRARSSAAMVSSASRVGGTSGWRPPGGSRA